MNARKYHVTVDGIETILKLTEKEQQERYPDATPYERAVPEGDEDERAAARRTGAKGRITANKGRTPTNKAGEK